MREVFLMEILAEIITDTLVKEKIINSDDLEIYKYGAELLISTGVNLLLGLLLGGLFHSMMSGVILLSGFGNVKNTGKRLPCINLFMVWNGILHFFFRCDGNDPSIYLYEHKFRVSYAGITDKYDVYLVACASASSPFNGD